MFCKKLNFVVAENMKYSQKVFAVVIEKYHTITKKQYFADFQCIKNIKKYLDAGVSVLICPEGKVSAEGKTGSIPDSIARLVKWLGYPVGVIISKGAGLSRPKWAQTGRVGRVVEECDMLFTAEQLKQLSAAQVYDVVVKALSHNEHVFQIENKIIFKGKGFAEGLERLLYRCPKCGAEFKSSTKEDLLTCNACGNTVRYEGTGKLVPATEGSVCPERIDLWADEIQKQVGEEVKDPKFSISKRVYLMTENGEANGYRFKAEGVLTLNADSITFEASPQVRPKNIVGKFEIQRTTLEVKDAEVEPVEEEFLKVSFPTKNYETIANIPGDSLDMYDEKHAYRLIFADDKASTKYAYAVEQLHKNR
jgi:DNA-directed RNA polymerase subunit RPC12/RpoP